jgi:Flp pilus assembly protein protease CpaA
VGGDSWGWIVATVVWLGWPIILLVVVLVTGPLLGAVVVAIVGATSRSLRPGEAPGDEDVEDEQPADAFPELFATLARDRNDSI